MKKYFVYSLMAATFGAMFASCGAKVTNTSDEAADSTAVEEQVEEKLYYTDDDVKAITGLTTFEVKTEAIQGMSGKNNSEGFEAKLLPYEYSAQNFNEWNQQLFDRLRTVADEGKIYADDLSEKTEASQVEGDLGIAVFTYVYKYNGTRIYVTLSSADDDDASRYSVTVSK